MTTRSPLSTVTVIVAVDGKEVRRFDAVSAHLLKLSAVHEGDLFKLTDPKGFTFAAVVFVRPDKIAESATFGSIGAARDTLKRFGADKARHSPIFTLDVTNPNGTPIDPDDDWT